MFKINIKSHISKQTQHDSLQMQNTLLIQCEVQSQLETYTRVGPIQIHIQKQNKFNLKQIWMFHCHRHRASQSLQAQDA